MMSFQLKQKKFIEKNKKYYIEGKNNINGNNIEIYINNKKKQKFKQNFYLKKYYALFKVVILQNQQ